jgi:hypothetical protein
LVFELLRIVERFSWTIYGSDDRHREEGGMLEVVEDPTSIRPPVTLPVTLPLAREPNIARGTTGKRLKAGSRLEAVKRGELKETGRVRGRRDSQETSIMMKGGESQVERLFPRE